MAQVRNIGTPENDSERKAILYLAKELPDDHIVLTNLELPTSHGLPYEYDMIVIGDKAVYVIETKAYGGEIRGNGSEWELSSERIVKSPIPLLNKKTKVVADRIRRYSAMLSDVWVESILVLSDDQVSVKVNDPQSHRIMKLSECVSFILSDSSRPPMRYIRRIEEAIAQQFQPLKRGKQIGDFKVIETLGRNDLFTTVLSEHKLLRPPKRYSLKTYTLKIYANEKEQVKHRERILREANMLFELPTHPNLARAALPFPWRDDQIVLPMEWVEGRTLRSHLEQGMIDRANAVSILSQLCDVLIHIHSYDVIHRDLRPDNLILTTAGQLKLVNFDRARMEGSDLTTIATRIGRQMDERYVAPEVWKDPSRASKSSDVFSFGIMLHELITGRTPYEQLKYFLSAQKIESRMMDVTPPVDPDLNDILMRMCAYETKDRISDLHDVKEAIEILL